MITVMNSFRVPGVPYVEIYRDANDANVFHLLPDHPRIAVDERSGLPLFTYTLFSRNIEIAYASTPAGQPVETQLGALTLTCDLTVSPQEWETIRLHLVSVLEAESAQPGYHNRIFKIYPTSAVPVMGYANTWTQGTVRMEMLKDMPGTFVKASSEERTPQLRGTMAATLWANFGTEGAQLLWDALHPKEGAPAGGAGAAPAAAKDVPLLANVVYDLTGVARGPALHVEIKADGGPIYTELRERMQISEQKDGQSWSYPQVSSLTKEMVDKRLITIDWKDYGIPGTDPNQDELKKKLQETVLGMITGKIVETFFRQLQVPGVKDEDLGKTFTHTTNGVPGSRLWLNDYKETNTFEIGFTLDYEANHTFKAYPQVSVLTAFTPAQRDTLVRVVDVGSPEVRVLSVPVYTNADFAGDKIANITTTLSYQQFDHLVEDWIETTDSFVFRTGNEAFTFRTRLARDAQGRLIDTYDAKAQINYVGTSQHEQPVELHGISERALTFSYDRLGYVNVAVQAGDIDWKEIDKVFVDLVYEPAAGQPDARGTVELTKDAPEGRWTTSKHGQTSNAYRYTVRFIMANGDETTAPTASDERGTLPIHDSLVGKLRRTFDVSLDPQTVENVVLKIRYEARPGEFEEIRQPFTATGSWEYVRALAQGAPREVRYSYTVQYKDGLVEKATPWTTLSPGEDAPAIQARRYRLPVQVDGGGLDWSRWRTVYTTVAYSDPDHGYDKVEDLRLTDAAAFVTVEMSAFSPRAREYTYRATFVPKDGSDPVERPANGEPARKSGPLLLEELV